MRRVAHRVAEWWPLAVSAAFLLPLVSLVRHPDVGWVMKLVVAATVVLAARVPGIAVLVVAVLLPLALALEILAGPVPTATAITEGLVFAFVAGAAWPAVAPAEGDRLRRPALLLAAIIMSSMLVEVGVRWRADGAYGGILWRQLTETYFFQPRLMEVVLALRWTALLLFATFVERLLRRTPALVAPAVRMWLAGGVAAASFTALRLAEVTLTRRLDPDPWTSLTLLWQRVRITALQPDVNAAGSYFALFLGAVLVLGVFYRRVRLLVLAGPFLLVAFAFTQSRAAFLGLALVLAGMSLVALLRRGYRRSSAGVAIGLVVFAVVAWRVTSATHISGQIAVSVRAELLEVGVAMIRDHPVFGVGLGRFLAASRAYITEDQPILHVHYQGGDNAHNNYVQMAAELGLPALGVFLWLVVAIWRTGPGDRMPLLEAERIAVGAGLAAFLVSALAGHPLLIPQVAAAFFLTAGIAAALSPSLPPPGAVSRWAYGSAFAWLAASVAWRLATA